MLNILQVVYSQLFLDKVLGTDISIILKEQPSRKMKLIIIICLYLGTYQEMIGEMMGHIGLGLISQLSSQVICTEDTS